MIKVLGIGDNVVDKYMHIQTMYPGGNALNFSVYAKLLGAESGYLGVFGDDDAAAHVYQTVRALEIDLTQCRSYHGENGYAEVKLEQGDRIFIGSNKGGILKEKPILLNEIDLCYLKEFDAVHTSVFSYMESQLNVISKHVPFVSMDFSDRADEEYFKRCAPDLDCVCISCGDQELDSIKAQMQKILSYGCKKMVLATRGAKGACLMTTEGFYQQSPDLIDAVDTMGAGDSFITCFLVHYLEGMKHAVDFHDQTGNRGLTTKDQYEDHLIQVSLYRAAVFAAKNCLKEGSFGYGKQF